MVSSNLLQRLLLELSRSHLSTSLTPSDLFFSGLVPSNLSCQENREPLLSRSLCFHSGSLQVLPMGPPILLISWWTTWDPILGSSNVQVSVDKSPWEGAWSASDIRKLLHRSWVQVQEPRYLVGYLRMSPQSQLPPKTRIVLLGLPSKLNLCFKGEAKSLPNLAQQGFPLDSHLFLLSPNPLFQKPKCRQQPDENHTSLEHLLQTAGQNLPGPWLRLPPRATSGHAVTEQK